MEVSPRRGSCCGGGRVAVGSHHRLGSEEPHGWPLFSPDSRLSLLPSVVLGGAVVAAGFILMEVNLNRLVASCCTGVEPRMVTLSAHSCSCSQSIVSQGVPEDSS
ncbi:hypothetical protein PybrP1_008917 [[Pythium] brassicae (nom. inval.)]|nr:hypothetical protein PybrP1_008917 [[Pythium] brassicae (nom. inval.)]